MTGGEKNGKHRREALRCDGNQAEVHLSALGPAQGCPLPRSYALIRRSVGLPLESSGFPMIRIE